jgi:hypothetical protein
MSENNTNSGLAGVIENLKSNPKALAIAVGTAALVLFLVIKGGSDEGVTPAKVVAVSVGQKVTVQNPNTDKGNTILLAAPGPVGLADSDNDKDDMIICKQVLSGTTAKLEEESVVNYIPFAKVTLNDGECAGKTGWMPKVNIK